MRAQREVFVCDFCGAIDTETPIAVSPLCNDAAICVHCAHWVVKVVIESRIESPDPRPRPNAPKTQEAA